MLSGTSGLTSTWDSANPCLLHRHSTLTAPTYAGALPKTRQVRKRPSHTALSSLGEEPAVLPGERSTPGTPGNGLPLTRSRSSPLGRTPESPRCGTTALLYPTTSL